MKYTTNEFGKQLAKRYGYTQKAAAEIIRDVFELLGDNIKNGDTTVIYQFGTFYTKLIGARTGHGFNVEEVFEIPAHYKPAITFSPQFKKDTRVYQQDRADQESSPVIDE